MVYQFRESVMPTPGDLPKYIAIAEGLARDIRAGRYAVGERLPGELDMAQTYDVSVGTLRKSLAELETRGTLHRIQGSGNYVSETTDHDAIYAFFRLERPDGGGLPTAQVLHVRFDDRPHRCDVQFAQRVLACDDSFEDHAASPPVGAVPKKKIRSTAPVR